MYESRERGILYGRMRRRKSVRLHANGEMTERVIDKLNVLGS